MTARAGRDLSRQREQISAHAFRLTEARPHPEIAPYCLANRLDYGFVPRDRTWKDIGLVVMDMDSTLITIECIDEIERNKRDCIYDIPGKFIRGTGRERKYKAKNYLMLSGHSCRFLLSLLPPPSRVISNKLECVKYIRHPTAGTQRSLLLPML